MINMTLSLVIVLEEEHTGPFKGTKNVLFKIDCGFTNVYSSVCVYFTIKSFKKENT